MRKNNNSILCNIKIICAKMFLPPHVSQSDCVPQAREEEVALVVPVSSAVGRRRRIVILALLGLLAGTHLDRCQRSFRASNKFSSFSFLSARKRNIFYKNYYMTFFTFLPMYLFPFESLLSQAHFFERTFSSSLRPTL